MKYIYISIFFILNLFISNNVIADQSVIKELQKGGKIVFIRHSLAPGNGDPDNIDLKKCDTQRNLNQEGIEQSKKIGILFSNNNIQIDKVLSSEWCRCKETAELLSLEKWTTFSGLNSFFQGYADKEDVLQRLYQKLSKLTSGVTLMVTHQVVIRAVTGQSVSSGELVAFNTRTKEVHKFRLD